MMSGRANCWGISWFRSRCNQVSPSALIMNMNGMEPVVCCWRSRITHPGRLAIGEPFGAWQERHERQPPGGQRGLSVRGEQRQKGVIAEQGLHFISEPQVSVS